MSRFRLTCDVLHAYIVRVTDEKRALLEQVIAFVRIRRVSRRATASEARAAIELEEHLERMLAGESREQEAVAA